MADPGALFTRQLWLDVAEDLRFTAKAWWEENRDLIVDMPLDELEDIMLALRKGDTAEAKIALATRLGPAEWRAYRDGTTEHLAAIARRRFALFEALEDLGRRAAMIIGGAALRVLGL